MSRVKRFVHSLASGYLLMGVNAVYTLASVPLALHYLSKAEFGLWALTLQVTNFIALVDLGMGTSIARILIDHKDERGNGRYGGAIQSGLLVGLTQGIIILVVGLSLVWFLAGWLRVPVELARVFFWLMAGQVLFSAATFSTRIFNQILYAWQRMDVSSYSGIVQLTAQFAAMWIGFFLRCGVFSLLMGAVVGWICGVALNLFACLKLGFWPKAHERGRISREQFRELFNYGADVFLISIGTQLIISSQTVLISRQLGVEIAALWTVMTRVFTFVSQVVWKIIGSAMPTFAEMQVRGEWERLWNRYRGLFIAGNVIAGICAVIFAACNSPFVTLWTQGKFSWPLLNNVLLGIWLVIMTQQCCHNSIIICFKQIKALKYIYLFEGVVFIGMALAILPSTGVTGMLVCSVLATTLFTWLSGVWRVAEFSKLGWKPLLWDWQKPLIFILTVLFPIGLLLEWLLRDAADWVQFGINGLVLAAVGIYVAARYALPTEMVVEFVRKLPRWLQRIGVKVIGKTI